MWDVWMDTSIVTFGWMWELDHKEGWALKNWCFWTVGLENLRVLWTARSSKQSLLKEISAEHSLEGLMLKLKLLWTLEVKDWSIGTDPDAGNDWRQEDKGTTEDGMVGWHHRLDGHEFEWTQGVGDGQGGLACCDSWSRKELDTTEQLNWTELMTSKHLNLFL